MASPPLSQSGEENHDPAIQNGTETDTKEEDVAMPDSPNHPHSETKTPEPKFDQAAPSSNTPSTPGILAPFDWDDFEARYEKALHDADEHEREILREAENLSKYFKVWASAASSHDDERAVKRLQTRQRFVNLAEEKMEQKQQHYEEVVRAFESALALLRSK